jgi:predicted amidophosphoribosyltransferase
VTTAEHYTDPYIAAYRRVPPIGDGVCGVCHRGVRSGAERCYSCNVTTRQVTMPVQEILPISLYEVPDQVWSILRNYKDSRVQQVREQLSTVVAATIARFTRRHWRCIIRMVGGEPSIVTTVPSTGGRMPPHPLVEAVQRSALLNPLHHDLLHLGDVPLRRLRASDRGFVSKYSLRGHRVLLVEDTFTSGTRTQSAASALRLAGADAVGVLVVGRVIEPGHSPDDRRVWDYGRAARFSFEICCRCTKEPCSPR